VLLYVTVLLLCILLHYIATGCPPLNLEHQFRRAEQAQWVGPAKILGTLELQDSGSYDHVLLAEDHYGTTMYLYSEDTKSGQLHYRKKTDHMQVLAVPGFRFMSNDDQIELPVIAFDRSPKAVRAELELVVDDGSAVQTYHAEAQRENDGYFCFTITQSGWGAQVRALRRLAWVSGGDDYLSPPYPFTIRLYSASGELLHEEQSEIRCASQVGK